MDALEDDFHQIFGGITGLLSHVAFWNMGFIDSLGTIIAPRPKFKLDRGVSSLLSCI